LITEQQKVWIFTFEYAGIIKVGGLGEVPANQAKNLANQFDITVFIPSHGQIERLNNILPLEKLPFNSVGLLNPVQIGIDQPESSYNIAFYKCKINNVNIILLSGQNEFTKRFLDDNTVYNPETINGKIFLFSIGMRSYIEYLIDHNKNSLPEIVHMHDYHVVIPFLSMKQILAKYGLDVKSIITIHLMSWPRYPIEFYRVCGIDDTPIKIKIKGESRLLTFNEIMSLAQDSRRSDEENHPPTVEKIGALISDLVTTVSQSYLRTDIIPNLGGDLIEFKSDFIWDGCDWEYQEIYTNLMKKIEYEVRETLEFPNESSITLLDLKEYLLTYKIGNLDQSPLINSKKIIETINEISNGNQFVKNGKIKSFTESGPLAISTGRISKQKGFEIIFEAIPEVIKVIPNAKFLLLILPTDYSLEDIKAYSEVVKKYPNNLRIIFGVASEVFHLAHLAADVYCALSRWEPFGIIALEAMAVKLPIIATKVGGLQESILDIRNDPEYGTGILIEKDNTSQFTDALISLLRLVQIKDKVKETGSLYETETLQMVNSIPDSIIKSRVLLDADYIDKIRENSYNRVKFNFRWEIVSQKLIELYQKLTN